jgi:hypothetical protein
MSRTVVISETFIGWGSYSPGTADRVPSQVSTPSETIPVPASAPRRALARAAYEAKLAVSPHPALAMPAARLRGHGVLVSSPGVEVLIEGYPRSANSFTVAAFARAQGWPGSGGGRIAHHTHAPAHVMEAIRRKIPAMVLIRDPAEGVLEFVLVKPDLTVRQALRGYLRFYEPLVPVATGFLTARFEDVTTDLGSVIERLNARFGTSFVPFVHSEEEERTVFEEMDGYWRGRLGSGPDLERFVGRPSQVREAWKERLRRAYEAPDLAGLRDRAGGLHESFPAVPPR